MAAGAHSLETAEHAMRYHESRVVGSVVCSRATGVGERPEMVGPRKRCALGDDGGILVEKSREIYTVLPPQPRYTRRYVQ